MLRLSILYLIFLSWGATLVAQDKTNPDFNKWSFNTAYLIPAGQWESGIFQPFRLGLKNKFEIHSNALILPLIQNAGIKIALGSKNGFVISSDHMLSSPTIFLRFISMKGIGGLISPEFDFPFILSFNNSVIVTKKIGSASLLSGNAGFVFAIRGRKPDPQSTIDLPLFYPRMAHFYEGTSVRFGLSFKGRLGNKWLYEEGLQTFFITRSSDNFFSENSGHIMFEAGKTLRIKGGYNLSFGSYPFGMHWQLWPSVDLVFGSRNKPDAGQK